MGALRALMRTCCRMIWEVSIHCVSMGGSQNSVLDIIGLYVKANHVK